MYRIQPARHHEDYVGSVIVGINISIIVVEGVHLSITINDLYNFQTQKLTLTLFRLLLLLLMLLLILTTRVT